MHTQVVPAADPPNHHLDTLRAEVRAFLREHLDAGVFTPGVDTWLTRWNPDFTKARAARRWLGTTIPAEYGGQGRTFMERFVVTEELHGDDAVLGASVVKVLGTKTEGDIADLVEELAGEPEAGDDHFAELVRAGVMQRPGFTLRGGTSEILRGVIARGLGMR
nr:acyl-CoA dehydrogenase family protein [Rhodococcus wratislaviensis]GLK39588.1 hypothetical protein GCM10017611_64590 [Rhodococcus wratislaviensis]